MKLIIAIVPDINNDDVSNALTSSNFKVTCIASTGGLLRRGNSTLLIGLENEKVETALEIIRENTSSGPQGDEHRGVVFVLDVDEYIQI